MDFARMAVAIATHCRPAMLQAVATAWATTAPKYRSMFVISNHPAGLIGFEPPERCVVTHLDWPPEHVGCMAKMWNLAMLWAFRDPEVEWLLCSMDDAEVTPGWPSVLGTRDADLYLAPAGDLVFLFNRRALRDVGWFDERFPVIGFQEWDWQARAIRALGVDRVVIEDRHGWRHNSIGLSNYWRHAGDGMATGRSMAFQGANEAWLVQKWGRDVLAMVDMLAGGNVTEPLVPEVDWYPWFGHEKKREQLAEPTARAWSRLEHGKTMLSKPEAYMWLTQTVAKERRRLGRPPMCVELGAWCGASAMALTEGGAYVMSVDTFRGSDQFTGKETLERLGQGRGSTFDLFVKNVFNSGYAGRVLPVVATSLEAARLFALAGACIDILYHDADHDKVAVLADLAAWWPVISPGGIVIGHDWNLVGQGVQAISQIVGMLPVSSGEICPDHTWMLRKG